MLDQYLSGQVSRVSPEAPVPVVQVKQDIYRLGGAANVAHNISSLIGESMLIAASTALAADVTPADQRGSQTSLLNQVQV